MLCHTARTGIRLSKREGSGTFFGYGKSCGGFGFRAAAAQSHAVGTGLKHRDVYLGIAKGNGVGLLGTEMGQQGVHGAALQRSCKICGAGLTNGSGRGKVMGGKGQSAFLRQKNEVVVMEPAGSSGSLYPRSKNQTAAFLHAGERPGCA